MKIAEISTLLKRELYENDYQYGFCFDGRKYPPNFKDGFDAEFFNLSKTVYRIQDPQDTMKEKIGTCIDAVIVMKTILDELNIPSKIWLLHHNVKKTPHIILTFEAEENSPYYRLSSRAVLLVDILKDSHFYAFVLKKPCLKASGKMKVFSSLAKATRICFITLSNCVTVPSPKTL